MYDRPESELLRLLAERGGIVAEYHDINGTLQLTIDETRRAILAAMGFRSSNRTELSEELTAWDDRPWLQGCDPVRIIRQGHDAGTWSLHVPCEIVEEALVRVHWLISSEDGETCYEREEGPGLAVAETRVINGRRHIRVVFALPSDLPLGYYESQVRAKGGSAAVEAAFRLIVAPARCYIPDVLEKGGRLWGLAVQLYSLRSQRNWGVGDFQDLATIIEWAGKRLGASVIGLNPLHALKNSKPYHISPYSPTSRLFLNDLYIDVEEVAEWKTALEAQRQLADPSFRARLKAVRASEFVDYDAVASMKRTLLDLCYRAFLHENFDGIEPDLKPKTARGWYFSRYVQQEGEPLLSYAVFQALEEEQSRTSGAAVWADWPAQYRNPRSEAVREFTRQHMRQVRFYLYLQWLAAEQLSALVKKTDEAGMTVGFYHDMALGSDRTGADSWRFQEVLALDADCGAPPDAFSPEGQNWGIPPTDPVRLRANGYQYFIELLRNNLRYGGAIRIDHVMALFRLFWIPRGWPASKGTYVHYQADDLLAILALESVRARALVIGEDLGTVPDWVRDRLGTAGVLSYRVLYFERTEAGACKPPVRYPAQSLAVVTTHDLPTLRGYWEGTDIDARAKLGLFPTEQARLEAQRERQRERGALLAALKSEGLLPPGMSDDPAMTPAMTEEFAEAVHRFLARSPAWMVLANVEDVIGTRDQANVPGTVDQHPNWSRKLGLTVDELMQDSRFERLAGQLRALRPQGRTTVQP